MCSAASAASSAAIDAAAEVAHFLSHSRSNSNYRFVKRQKNMDLFKTEKYLFDNKIGYLIETISAKWFGIGALKWHKTRIDGQ